MVEDHGASSLVQHRIVQGIALLDAAGGSAVQVAVDLVSWVGDSRTDLFSPPVGVQPVVEVPAEAVVEPALNQPAVVIKIHLSKILGDGDDGDGNVGRIASRDHFVVDIRHQEGPGVYRAGAEAES